MSRFVQDLFTVAMGGGTIRRYGEVAVVVLPGVALVTTRQDIQHAQRWARALSTSGVESEDRSRLLGQLNTVIARADHDDTTRGTAEALTQLAVRMRENNMNLDSWHVPKPVLAGLPPPEAKATET